jgi:phosphohistidine phosphatase
MLTLSLLRHAKSSWADPTLDDHDRPLAKRGVKAMPEIAKYLRREQLRPSLVLCSSAVRTRATVALLLAGLGPPAPELVSDDALYLAQPSTLLAVLRETSPSHPHVMLVGHNPGLHALALELVGDGDRKLVGALAMEFPTAALAVLTFPLTQWTDVRAATGRLDHFATPRSLAGHR